MTMFVAIGNLEVFENTTSEPVTVRVRVGKGPWLDPVTVAPGDKLTLGAVPSKYTGEIEIAWNEGPIEEGEPCADLL